MVDDDLFDDDELDDDDDPPASRTRRSSSQGQQSRSGSGPRGRRFRRAKICTFCVDRATHIDYKDVDLLQRYVSHRGKILPRRQTGTCAKHQRALAGAVKRARHVALLPFTSQHTLD